MRLENCWLSDRFHDAAFTRSFQNERLSRKKKIAHFD